jgi:outer membrane protein assembly factor BamB
MLKRYQTEIAVAVLVAAVGALFIFTGGSSHRVAGAGAATNGGPIKKWEFQLGARAAGSPAIAPDGTIYVTGNGGLVAIAPDGKEKWRSPYLQVTSSPMIGPDGTIYFTELHGSLYAYNPGGSRAWPDSAGGVGMAIYDTAPLLGNGGAVYIVSGGINAYSANDGTRLWQNKQSMGFAIGLAQLAAVGPDGNILVGAANGQFYSFQPTDGSIAWQANIRDAHAAGGTAIGADGTIYVGADNGVLYAVFNDGKPRWEFKAGAPISTEPAVADDGTIYVAAENTLYAVGPDGEKRWAFQTTYKFTTAPALAADGTIYCPNADKKLYAISPDGSKKWEYASGDAIFNPPNIAPDGTVYVINLDGTMMALSDSNGGLMHSAWPRFQHDAANTGNASTP